MSVASPHDASTTAPLESGATADGPSLRSRLVIAFVVGAIWMSISYMLLRYNHMLGADFTWPWRAARELLAGQNPYTVPRSSNDRFGDPLFYPLPAVLVAMPFAAFQPEVASAFFIGVSFAVLTYGILANGFGRLPILFTFCSIAAAYAGQWSPLLTAAALVPGLSWLFVVKPNLGIALLAYRPSRVAVIGGAAFVAVSIATLPSWPFDWLHNLRGAPQYAAPISYAGGPLLLLALLRWRRPEARLLFVMACVPQSLFFYDQLPLLLVCLTLRESLALAILSVAAWELAHWVIPPSMGLVERMTYTGPVILALLYLPALLIVLRRPNIGAVPWWLERLASHVAALTPSRFRDGNRTLPARPAAAWPFSASE